MKVHHVTRALGLSLAVCALAPAMAGAAPPAGAPAAGPAAEGAQGGPSDSTALAKATQNPVSDLVSFPFQFNFNSGGALGDQSSLLLNVQPVIPIPLAPRWNLISRTIIPVVDAPAPEGQRFRGLGDILEQTFFTPSHPKGLIWGLGPFFSFPTATAASASTGSWAAGPGGVLVETRGPFVVGLIASQLVTFADSGGDPKVDLFTLQYFINYNFGDGWAISTAPLITADWDAAGGNQWTVPFGLGITKTTVFAGQPMSIGAQYYANLVRPDSAPANQLRVTISLLFPTHAAREARAAGRPPISISTSAH